MPEQAPEVFISFANEDGLPLARKLEARLRSEGIATWFEPNHMRGGDPWKRQILEALDQVRFLVLVLTKGAEGSKWVFWEWKNARSRGVHIAPVIPEDPALMPEIDKFPGTIKANDLWKDPSQRERLILHIKSRPLPPPRVPFLVPDPPRTYVQREREYQELRGLLLDKERRDPIAITTSIQGGGGFGKSTLAKALCHDEDVYHAFTDGIAWVELGPKADESTVLRRLSFLYKAFTRDEPYFTHHSEAAATVADKIRDLSVLIVVDDVWRESLLKHFLWDAPNCARLFTTRRKDIAASVQARGVRVDRMSSPESVDVLRNHLSDRFRGVPKREQLERLGTRVGEMPLMLALVGKALNMQIVREQGDVDRALTRITERLDRKGVVAVDVRDETHREYSIARTIELSLEFLKGDERERAEELGIFPPETPVPFSTIGALWGIDASETEDLAYRLDDVAVVTAESGHLRLHDVVRDYLARALEKRVPPSDLHARLIDRWGDLHILPDGYAWRNVAHHLIEAGRKNRLRELLLDYRWLRAKFRATGPISLCDDAMRFPDDDRDMRYLARALGQSAHVLARDPSALRGQLYGRLMGIESEGVQGLVEQIGMSSEEGPWLRPLRPSLTPADSPLVRTLEGHGDWVNAVAVTADGLTAVSGSDDGTVRVWDLATGKSRTLVWKVDRVLAVAVTPDGRTAVSGSDKGSVRVWDLATGLSRPLKGPGGWDLGGPVNSVSVTSDGCTVVSGMDDGTVRVWDMDAKKRRAMQGHSGRVCSVAVTSDGRTIVSGSEDHAVRVWCPAKRSCRVLLGHDDRVNAVAVTSDGTTVISGSEDATIRVWDLARGTGRPLNGGVGAFRAVALASDGLTAVSGSGDSGVLLWDLATEKARPLEGHCGWVNAVALTSDGLTAISGSGDHTVRVWNLDAEEARTLKGHDIRGSCVALTPDGGTAISGSTDGTVRVWDLATGEARLLTGRDGAVRAVALTSNGLTAAWVLDDGSFTIQALKNQNLQPITGYIGEVTAVTLTSDCRSACSISRDGTVWVWNLAAGTSRELVGHRDWVSAVGLSLDGRFAISGSLSGVVRIWDQASAVWRTMSECPGPVGAVALTSDGLAAVSASSNGTVRIWDLVTGKSQSQAVHGNGFSTVSVSPGGSTVVFGSLEGALWIWDVATGPAREMFHADGAVTSCAVSSIHRTIVASDSLGRVHFLRLEDGAPVSNEPKPTA